MVIGAVLTVDLGLGGLHPSYVLWGGMMLTIRYVQSCLAEEKAG